jgi:hypothetical protein
MSVDIDRAVNDVCLAILGDLHEHGWSVDDDGKGREPVTLKNCKEFAGVLRKHLRPLLAAKDSK